MKGLFKPKPRTPMELVLQTRDLLFFLDQNTETRERKRDEKNRNPDACAQLAQEFFKHDTFRLLVACLPKLDLGARQNATHVIANLQRQRVGGRYEDGDIALTYGAISRECIRHQIVARYVLGSEYMKKCFTYIQIPNFDIASDAQATFKVKELLTRHKSTVAEFLSANYYWRELMASIGIAYDLWLQNTCLKWYQTIGRIFKTNNVIAYNVLQLLGDMLLDRSNSSVMIRYVSSLDNMRILMNLFRDSNKTIQLDTFQVFKLFAANKNKPPEIISVLVTNRSKLLRFLGDFSIDKEDEQFEADKAQVIKDIATLEIISERSCTDADDCEVES
ncbi:hypothetical protein OIU76_005119 [Salix suchowensis]|nr:hypothetical protein OIU76_005119 [Salix suchowensis]